MQGVVFLFLQKSKFTKFFTFDTLELHELSYNKKYGNQKGGLQNGANFICVYRKHLS